jgi:hypothetical protein
MDNGIDCNDIDDVDPFTQTSEKINFLSLDGV